MRHLYLPLLAAVASASAMGAESSPVDARAKFLADHPAAARIIDRQPISLFNNNLITNGATKFMAPPQRVAALPQFWGNMVGSDAWTGRYIGYGVYNFQPSSPINFNTLFKGDEDNMKGNGGAVKIDNKYYLVNWGVGFSSLSINYYVFDANTWALLDSGGLYTPNVVATDLAYDRLNNKCYGACFNSSVSGYELVELDYSLGYPRKSVTIAPLNLMVVGLGVNSKGELYGICEDGVLYKFNTKTGEATRIGDTGVKVASAAGVVQQTAEFDQHSDTFYWMANDVYGNYTLYTVDTSTAAVTKVADVPDHSRMLNLQVMAPSAADKAPNFITDLTAQFNNGELSGKVSFKVPDDTYDGSKLEGTLAYTVSINGSTKATGKTSASAVVNADVTALQGNSLIEVWVENGVGKSPVSSTQLYIGYDRPVLKSVNYKAEGRFSTISWAIDEKGENGGYLGRVSYKVVRMPDNYVVTTKTYDTTIEDELPADAPMRLYSYMVTPTNNGVIGSSMTSNGNLVGSAMEVPYTQTFDSESTFDLITTIDGNGDGHTWLWDTENMFSDNGVASISNGWDEYETTFNDWLLTPEIHLEAGKTYQVSFKALSRAYADAKDRLSVAYGIGNDPSKYITILTPQDMRYTASLNDYEVTLDSDKDQNVRFGFRRQSSYTSAKMLLDDIRITSLGTLAAPASATDVTVKAHPEGDLTAEISFKTPAVNKGGNPLSSLSKSEIYVGTQLAATINNPTPGTVYTKTVKVPSNGEHSFRIENYNEDGSGVPFTIKQFVGVDAPGSFRTYIVDNFDRVTVKWDSCDKGANGRYVNPDRMVYNVYFTDGSTLGQLMASNLKGNEWSFDYNTQEGDIAAVRFAVVAQNDADTSRPYMTPILIVGEPYTLPYEEHFDGKSGYIYDGDDDDYFGMSGGSSSDGDDKCISWVTMFDTFYDTKELKTLKIAMNPDYSPLLSFDYRQADGNTITVSALLPDGTERVLETLTEMAPTGSWSSASIDLSSLNDQRYIRLRFLLARNDNDERVIQIDNLRIVDAIAHNLTPVLTLPESVNYGEYADITAGVINNGYETSGKYKLSVYAGNELIGTKEGDNLAYSKTETFHFVYHVPVGSPSEIEITAVVESENDERPSDDTLTAILKVNNPKVSAPENLRGGADNNGITLKWDAPTKFYSEKITDDFESYQPWIIQNIGEWLTIDADGASVDGIDAADFPHEGEPQAFMVFNPGNLGVPSENGEAAPYSGRQYLACFAADVNEVEHNDDWLISPILSGEAQDITFYAKEMLDDMGDEKIQVLYSTTGREIADFTLLEEFDIFNVMDWRRIKVSLPEGALYFAIRVVTRDGYMCMIDDITYTAGSCREITGWKVYRDGNFIADVPTDILTYTDTNGSKANRYNVTAVYATGEESNFSNNAMFNDSLDSTFVFGSGYTVVTPDGKVLRRNAPDYDGLQPGIYIINGKKVVITK